jgi:hypothetical protein
MGNSEQEYSVWKLTKCFCQERAATIPGDGTVVKAKIIDFTVSLNTVFRNAAVFKRGLTI